MRNKLRFRTTIIPRQIPVILEQFYICKNHVSQTGRHTRPGLSNKTGAASSFCTKEKRFFGQ
jgi:hypothetical protein